MVGQFKGRKIIAQKRLNFFSRDPRPFFGLDERHGPVAEFLVFDRHDHGLHDPLDVAQVPLDLLGLDVFAAGDEHIVLAAQDGERAVLF